MGQVAAVELHAFDNVGFCFQTFVFFDGDHAFVADFLHRVSDLTANFASPLAEIVPTCATSALSLTSRDMRFDRSNNVGNCQIDAALQVHWVHASGNRFHAFFDDGLGQNRRGGGAVASFVIGALKPLP